LGELKEALIAAGEAYADEDALPKGLINDLAGLYAWVYSSSHLYEDEEADQIRRSAMELLDVIFRYVAPADDEVEG
jgi:hypothetical protein